LVLNEELLRRWRSSDLLLMGGSAGSFKLLFRLVKHFTPELNKTVIIVIHRKKNYYSEIEKLFADHCQLPLYEISDKMELKRNCVYIAPANYHTLIENERQFSLDVSEAVWYSKPSIDVTFDSAARVFKNRCTTILLSGANQDGAEGLLKQRKYGSLTIVQNPVDAEMGDMPQSAIDINAAEFVLSAEDIFDLLQI
jgi:two-component system chemotaxis response regulator CheB